MMGRSLSGLPSGPDSFTRNVAELPALSVEASMATMTLRGFAAKSDEAMEAFVWAWASITREVLASAKST